MTIDSEQQNDMAPEFLTELDHYQEHLANSETPDLDLELDDQLPCDCYEESSKPEPGADDWSDYQDRSWHRTEASVRHRAELSAPQIAAEVALVVLQLCLEGLNHPNRMGPAFKATEVFQASDLQSHGYNAPNMVGAYLGKGLGAKESSQEGLGLVPLGRKGKYPPTHGTASCAMRLLCALGHSQQAIAERLGLADREELKGKLAELPADEDYRAQFPKGR